MKKALGLLFLICLSFHSPKAHSAINLRVKIAQVVGTQTIETVKTVSANYGQDIVVMTEGNLAKKIVFKLIKFKNILVNGNKINPVQIDMKVVSDLNKEMKTKTVTSFYNRSALFESPNMNVSLNFEEI